MFHAGIDIGSRTIKLVLVQDGEIYKTRLASTGFQPMTGAKKLLQDLPITNIMATGYGRNLFEQQVGSTTVTEIKACARGLYYHHPEVTTILDIGGQDVKVIRLGNKGRVLKFEMNDKCAAGTGKFLEIMSDNLGFTLDTFGDEALSANHAIPVSSMCTVFAETEITSLLARGEDSREIALGLHQSVVKRAASMIRRTGGDGPLALVGGVAKNSCIQDLLAKELERDIVIPPSPQTIVALGAALLCAENSL